MIVIFSNADNMLQLASASVIGVVLFLVFKKITQRTSKEVDKNIFSNGADEGIVKNGKLYYNATVLKSNIDMRDYEDFSKVKILFIKDGIAHVESIINTGT